MLLVLCCCCDATETLKKLWANIDIKPVCGQQDCGTLLYRAYKKRKREGAVVK